MTVAGRRSRTKPGPDGAPRTDSLDIRWGEDWRYLVTVYPDTRSYLLRVARDAWDAGHRADHDDPNPYWLDPDIAGHDDTPPAARSTLLMPTLQLPALARTVIYYVLGILNAANVAAFIVLGYDDKRLLAAQVFLGALSTLFFGVAASNVRKPPDATTTVEVTQEPEPPYRGEHEGV